MIRPPYPTNLQSALNEIDTLRSQIKVAQRKGEYFSHIYEAAMVLLDHPTGCRCENNGAGDCGWCERANDLKNALADMQGVSRNETDRLPDSPTCPECGDTPSRGDGWWRWTETKDWDHKCRKRTKTQRTPEEQAIFRGNRE